MYETLRSLSDFIVLSLAPASALAADKEVWTSVSSRNFFLVGNANEREIQEVAARLEQFRGALTQFFAGANVALPVETNVIVFRTDESYRPFKPIYEGQPSNVSGYFQGNPDLNYITLSVEGNSVRPYSTIFHEYVHLFVENNLRGLPLALNEGLAEYFSTFDVAEGGRKATTGKANAFHLKILRTREWVPLEELLAVDNKSALYNERPKQEMFYAQSWALVHYLILGRGGERQTEFFRFVELVAAGKPALESFREAFQTDTISVEKELREYIKRDARPLKITLLDKSLEPPRNAPQSAPLMEAEVQYYFGDLLLHTNRLTEAEGYLKEALRLDPRLAMAHASLGMLRVKQKNFDEAVPLLRRAAELAPQNYLARYYYAYGLSRQGMNEHMVVAGYEPDVARVMRAELLRAIELAPYYPESYRLLAFVSLATGEYLDQAASMVRRAMTIAPGRYEFALVLAQIYLRKRDFQSARDILEPMSRGTDAALRLKAQPMLDAVTATEREYARLAQSGIRVPEATNTADASSVAASPLKPRLPKRFEGERVRGLLMNVECAESEIVLTVKAGERALRLRSESLRRIAFVAYVGGMGRSITCGPRQPSNLVVLTYLPWNNPRGLFDGEAVAVEFVPEDLEFEQ